MAKYLVVVESPSKANTIKKYLGKDYKVVASMGLQKNCAILLNRNDTSNKKAKKRSRH